jgi:hypothetical protein
MSIQLKINDLSCFYGFVYFVSHTFLKSHLFSPPKKNLVRSAHIYPSLYPLLYASPLKHVYHVTTILIYHYAPPIYHMPRLYISWQQSWSITMPRPYNTCISWKSICLYFTLLAFPFFVFFHLANYSVSRDSLNSSVPRLSSAILKKWVNKRLQYGEWVKKLAVS